MKFLIQTPLPQNKLRERRGYSPQMVGSVTCPTASFVYGGSSRGFERIDAVGWKQVEISAHKLEHALPYILTTGINMKSRRQEARP